jgi:very-short-patch-repair endonuclease
VRCALLRRKPSESSGGACATEFGPRALIIRRQVRIGRYIADFACHAARIVIEVDGSQHAGSAADEERRKVLEANGYRVLRYWNNDVLSNIDGVLEDILSAITTTPTPNPSPQGGGEHTERAAAVRLPQRGRR